MNQFDVIILGAGAAGLMCAAQASQRGRKVLVIDHQPKPGAKILIAGGGRCNFSNLSISPENYNSQNRPFCISALKRFPPQAFLALMKKYDIAYETKNETQLFCKRSSRELLNALLAECGVVQFKFGYKIQTVDPSTPSTILRTGRFTRSGQALPQQFTPKFVVNTTQGEFIAKSLVVATGGITYPQLGATDLGLKIAKQFGHHIITPRPALTSWEMSKRDRALFGTLAGISLPVKISFGIKCYSDSLLFTHTGISGPAVYNISLYAPAGDELKINLCPALNLLEHLTTQKTKRPQAFVKTVLSELLPQRLVLTVNNHWFVDKPLTGVSKNELEQIAQAFACWKLSSEKSTDLKTAKVMAGGVDTRELSSKTMESLKVKNLYFVGEVMDVTGEQGGY